MRLPSPLALASSLAICSVLGGCFRRAHGRIPGWREGSLRSLAVWGCCGVASACGSCPNTLTCIISTQRWCQRWWCFSGISWPRNGCYFTGKQAELHVLQGSGTNHRPPSSSLSSRNGEIIQSFALFLQRYRKAETSQEAHPSPLVPREFLGGTLEKRVHVRALPVLSVEKTAV